jgi:hypothetical protein
MSRPAVIVVLVALLAGCTQRRTQTAAATRPTAASPWLRVNQVGYLPDDPKIALLSSKTPLTGTFTVGNLSASIGPDEGPFGPFPHNYRLDFTPLTQPGRYTIHFQSITSPTFTISPDAYRDVPPKLLDFMRLQRCGNTPNPVTGQPCHLQDAIDTETGRRVDLVGGWHDAADRLKHMITTTYCVAALYLAGADDEARWGAALVKRLHPDADTIYVQIGDDRDHLPPQTLWHDDRSDYGHGPGAPRSAWPATGKPQGPRYHNQSTGLANLAGRAAAAMALAGEIETARSLYRLAQSHPGCAQSVPVRSPYYYGESTFYDDLEWAATELYVATKDPAYMSDAIAYSLQGADTSWMGLPRHGHYEFFPYVNLAHWRLFPLVDRATQQQLAGYYRTGLEKCLQLANQNPYRVGTPMVWCSTNNVIALATQAQLYEQMTGDKRYRRLAAEARDWIFGRNPWGVCFVIGVPPGGTTASHPHHLFDKLAHHLPIGGLVDGPVAKDINDSLKFSPFGDDPYAAFQSDVAVYHDAYDDFSTNEPIIDGTVSLLLLLRLWQ